MTEVVHSAVDVVLMGDSLDVVDNKLGKPFAQGGVFLRNDFFYVYVLGRSAQVLSVNWPQKYGFEAGEPSFSNRRF
jgi:hypothetical protein